MKSKENLSLLVEEGLSISGIAARLNSSNGSIAYQLRKYGLKTKNKTPSKYIPYEERIHARCNLCEKTLPVSDFYTYTYKNGIKRPSFYCKSCSRKSFTDPRLDRKKIAIEYKGGKCYFCGYNTCVKALEFHHIEPDHKDFTLSTKLGKLIVDMDFIKKELDKCVLLCANCHRELHAGVLELPSNITLT